jgi:hypothetical protein
MFSPAFLPLLVNTWRGSALTGVLCVWLPALPLISLLWQESVANFDQKVSRPRVKRPSLRARVCSLAAASVSRLRVLRQPVIKP